MSTMLQNGTFYGDGTGFLTTEDGELVTYRGARIGWPTGPGWSSSFRGALYYQTASKKLAEANKVVGVYGHRSDANGANQIKVWEWEQYAQANLRVIFKGKQSPIHPTPFL